jgi:hypothetical protein
MTKRTTRMMIQSRRENVIAIAMTAAMANKINSVVVCGDVWARSPRPQSAVHCVVYNFAACAYDMDGLPSRALTRL